MPLRISTLLQLQSDKLWQGNSLNSWREIKQNQTKNHRCIVSSTLRMDRIHRSGFFSQGLGWAFGQVSLQATSYISLIEFVFPLRTDIFSFLLNDFCACRCYSIVSLPQAEIRLVTCVAECARRCRWLTLCSCMPCSWGPLINRIWWFDDITFRSEIAVVLGCQERLLLSHIAWAY